MENNYFSAQVKDLPIEDNEIKKLINKNSNEISNQLSNQSTNQNETLNLQQQFNDSEMRSTLDQSYLTESQSSLFKKINLDESTNKLITDCFITNSQLNQSTEQQTKSDTESILSLQLADFLVNNNNNSSLILIDSRSFIEYNSCHIQEAINVCCSKIIKRRLQNDKTTVRELLNNVNNGANLDNAFLIVVYDQSSQNVSSLPEDSCLRVLWSKLVSTFKNVRFLKGGFNEFHQNFNTLCTNKAQLLKNRQKKLSMDAISQPCLPNVGPTRILPFLYLGSQNDAMNQELLKNYNITYELNVSKTCPKPDFIQDSKFLRIPVNDNYSDKLLPHFPRAINFLDKVKESSGCVLVHCLGGISRSATIAIAYIMQHMKMTSDDAYRFLKHKRATISPNFNFLGQLLEYEKQLIDSCILPTKKTERHENGVSDQFHFQALTPSLCDLNNKTFNSSSPKHHVLHHHFNQNLNTTSNQEKKTNNQRNLVNNQTNSEQQEVNASADSRKDTNLNSPSSTQMHTTNSTSQFANCMNNNGAQKRTCSFSSSPNTRNKMTLKIPNENDNLGSIVFM